MADSELADLTAKAVPAADDLLYLVDEDGSPADRKITVAALGAVIGGGDVTQEELDEVESDLAAAIAAGDASTLTSAQAYTNSAAVLEADTSTAAMAFVIDEDNMASNSATKVPTQQSVKAYVDNQTGGFMLIDADRASRSSGSITLNSATWANLDTGLDLTLGAGALLAGDVVRCGVSGMHNATGAVNNYLDVATIVGGSPVSYLSGGAGGASSRGVVAWSGEASTATPFGGVAEMALGSGDLSSGSVLLRLRYRQSSAAARDLFATADIRLHWWAEVYRPN